MGFDLLALLRKNREGVQHERTLRAIYVLLSGWCRFKNPQKASLVEPPGKLQAIPFDKLVMLYARLWDELFRRTGAKFKNRASSITEEENKQAITFPVPYKELPGKHGPGRAVCSHDQKPEFIVSIIHRLKEEDILPYFDVSPPVGSPANDYRTTIAPALSSASDDTLIEDYTEYEREVLRDLNNALKRLDDEEIRALGTHENFTKTSDDVQREFNWMQKWLGATEANIKAGKPFHKAMREVLEYTDEASRKSERNRKDYARARQLFEAELSHALLKEVFLDCQRPPEEIWDRNEMKTLAQRARRAYAVAHYLERVAHLYDSGQNHTQQDNLTLQEVSNALKTQNIHEMPDSIDQIFVAGTPVLTESTKTKLLQLVAELKTLKSV
jgi:hypothetical protein